MDYYTAHFTGNRIVPKRNLGLPIRQIDVIERIRPLPVIFDGKVYTADAENGLCLWDERSFECLKKADVELNEAGIFAAGPAGFYIRSATGNVHHISWGTLETIEVCKKASYLWNGHDSVSFGKFSIIDCQIGEGWLAPTHLSRRELGDCDPVWVFRPEMPGIGCGISKNYIVVQDSHGKVCVLSIDSGEMLWSKSIEELDVLTPEEINTKNKGEARDYPHILGDVIVLGSQFDYLIGVNLHSGDLVWKRKIESNTGYPCVTEDGKVYKFTDFRTKKSLLILDAATGETIQEWDLAGAAEALGISDILSYQSYGDVTETHFWGTTTHGLLFAVNLATGEIDLHEDLGETIPYGDPFIICNNRLYMTTMNKLITFEGVGGYIKD